MTKALILAASGYEDSELLYPYYRIQEMGGKVHIASPEGGEIEGEYAYSFEVNLSLEDVEVENYDLLVIPGGSSPESLRVEGERAAEIVDKFDNADKPIGAICHGAQLLVSADIVEGREVTAYWGVMDDLRAAGGYLKDDSAVLDGNLVTSRHPDDLPDFMTELLNRV